jgi:AraC-like DNA-binding protein
MSKLFSRLTNLHETENFEKLFVDLEAALGITITVHDRAAIFRNVAGESLLPFSRMVHRHSYCRLGREEGSEWDKNCLNHCRYAVNAEALKLKVPFQHFCWKGAHEIVVPLVRDKVRLGSLFAGVFRPADRQTPPKNLAKLKEVKRAYQKLKTVTPEKIETITNILQVFGQGLLQRLDVINRLQTNDQDRKTEIRRFFYYRAQDPIRLRDLANSLFLSPSRASHLVQELFGVSFTEMLIQERMNRGKTLLVSSNFTAGEIARRVGIPDQYHFNRLFKKRTGLPPGAFREEKKRLLA